MASKSAIAILEQKNTGEISQSLCYGQGTDWRGNSETINTIQGLISQGFKINSVNSSTTNDKGSIFITIAFEKE